MPAKKNKTIHLLRPAAKAWELWSLPEDKKPALLQTAKTLQEIKHTPNTILAFPVSALFHLSVWLIRTEKQFLPELIAAQLEKRGLLQGSAEETVTGTDICAMSDSLMLCRITILPQDIDQDLAPAWPEYYDLAARYFPFSDNSIVLWRELGELCAAFVRGGKPVHFQSLDHTQITTACLEEIYLLQLSLEAQAITEAPTKIRLWGEFTPEEVRLTQAHFQGQTLPEPLPPPKKATSLLNLTPHFVSNIKKENQRRAARKKTIALAAALYLAAFSLFGLYIGFLHIQKNFINTEIQASADEVEMITKTKDLWTKLEPIIDPDLSPLEMLYHTARLLPDEGVRFTSFEMDTSSIIIQGEASSFPDAFTFTQNVKENPELTLYVWEDPNPTLLPNNKAQFQLLGRSIYAPADTQ